MVPLLWRGLELKGRNGVMPRSGPLKHLPGLEIVSLGGGGTHTEGTRLTVRNVCRT